MECHLRFFSPLPNIHGGIQLVQGATLGQQCL